MCELRVRAEEPVTVTAEVWHQAVGRPRRLSDHVRSGTLAEDGQVLTGSRMLRSGRLCVGK